MENLFNYIFDNSVHTIFIVEESQELKALEKRTSEHAFGWEKEEEILIQSSF